MDPKTKSSCDWYLHDLFFLQKPSSVPERGQNVRNLKCKMTTQARTHSMVKRLVGLFASYTRLWVRTVSIQKNCIPNYVYNANHQSNSPKLIGKQNRTHHTCDTDYSAYHNRLQSWCNKNYECYFYFNFFFNIWILKKLNFNFKNCVWQKILHMQRKSMTYTPKSTCLDRFQYISTVDRICGKVKTEKKSGK